MDKKKDTLTISKKEGVVCWKVNAEKLTPNTALELTSSGITVILKIDGESKTVTKSIDSINSIINPGKGKKLFGGNKSYGKVDIFAVDQSSEFIAEWGIAGDMAIPCKDGDFGGIDYKAIAYGKYFYKVSNFVNFINTMQFDGSGIISRDKIREFLRAETTGIVRGCLTEKISGKDLKNCQTKISSYAEEIKEKINRHLDSKGLEVYSFVFENLSYDPEHEAERKALSDAKVENVIVNVKCDTIDRKTDSEAKKTNDVIIPLHKAVNGNPDKQYEAEISRNYRESHANYSNNGNVKFCPNCGCRNKTESKFCTQCGEKF